MLLQSFSCRSFLSYHIRKLGGEGPKAEDFFLKSVQNDKSCQEILKKLGVIFFPTKHKSSHNFSTRHFDDKVTSDLDFLAHLAPKNNIMSFSPVLRTCYIPIFYFKLCLKFPCLFHTPMFPMSSYSIL